jgi:hypothetical protein
MASERQLTANRRNDQKSTGPKSRAGKRRASQNAFRHGLSAGNLLDADWIKKIEALAKKIVDSRGGQIDLEQARSVAHAQLEVLRARSISTAVVAQILAGCDHNDWTPSADREQFAVPPEGPDQTAEPIGRALSALELLARYESHAAARRHRAIREIFKTQTGAAKRASRRPRGEFTSRANGASPDDPILRAIVYNQR